MGMNLEVGLEMLPCGARWTTVPAGPGYSFYRSLMSFNPDDYDGATYYFEIVCTNSDAAAAIITLIDTSNSNAAVATVTMEAGCSVKRYRSTSFTLASGNHILAIAPVARTVASYIWQAHIIVAQVNAIKTRLQFQLLSGLWNTIYQDAPGDNIESTSSDTYTQVTPGLFSLFLKTESQWGTISTGADAWTLECVGCGSSGIRVFKGKLFQAGGSTAVTDSEVTSGATATPTLCSASFANNATNFTDGATFELQHERGTAGGADYLNKAHLYVRLVAPLAKAAIYRHVGCAKAAAATAVAMYNDRFLYTPANYSTPTVYFEAVGLCNENTAAEIGLNYVNGTTGDSGTGAGTLVTNSGHAWNSATKARWRSGAITLSDGDRVWAATVATTANQTDSGADLVITCVGAAAVNLAANMNAYRQRH